MSVKNFLGVTLLAIFLPISSFSSDGKSNLVSNFFGKIFGKEGTKVGGIDVGNGGDSCENRINSIRDDIKEWISKGGAKGLKLPAQTSVEDYNEGMLKEIKRAQVSCLDGNTQEEANRFKIGESEKTCINFQDTSGRKRIICHRSRFMGTNESEQYVLVHHEYAGLSGLELNDGDEESQYQISNQISAFLEYQVVRKLTVKERATETGWERNALVNKCSPPNGNSQIVFELIENSSVEELRSFLDSNIVAFDIVNEFCENMLFQAVRLRKMEHFNAIVDIYNINVKDILNIPQGRDIKRSLFDYAIHFSSLQTIQMFRMMGGALRASIKPFYYAVETNEVEVVQHFLEELKDINEHSYIKGSAGGYLTKVGPQPYTVTPLIMASIVGRNDLVKSLIEVGAQVDKGNKDGGSPLMLAAAAGKKEIVLSLLQSGAKINLTSTYDGDKLRLDEFSAHYARSTALFYAIRWGREDIVKILVHAGAMVNLEDWFEVPPLTYAVVRGSAEMIEFLIRVGNADKEHSPGTVFYDSSYDFEFDLFTAYEVASYFQRPKEILDLLRIEKKE